MCVRESQDEANERKRFADLLHNDIAAPTVPQFQELLSEIGKASRIRQMDGYIRASGLVLYPYMFIAGPNKHDCSRRTRLLGNS